MERLKEIMTGMERIKRTAKKLFTGRLLWPRAIPKPRTYEEQIYAGLINERDVCFDIGANKGDIAIFMAGLAAGPGLVVAFEPAWEMYFLLCRRIRSGGSAAPILPVPFGLADNNRDSIINVPNKNFGMGSIADATAWSEAQPGAQIESYHVKLITLDSFLAETRVPLPTFIKIDVEGAELFVLQGAVQMFDKRGHRPLMLIEVFAPWERAFGYHPWKLQSLLLERGYHLLFICPNGLVEHTPSEAHPFPPEYETGYNILAYCPSIHEDRIERIKWMRHEHEPKILAMAPPPRPNVINKSRISCDQASTNQFEMGF